jgi:hypothetical protein
MTQDVFGDVRPPAGAGVDDRLATNGIMPRRAERRFLSGPVLNAAAFAKATEQLRLHDPGASPELSGRGCLEWAREMAV